MRVEDDLRPAPNGPAHGLRIPPPLVTDDDTEGEIADGEHASFGARQVQSVFRRIDLDLVLEPRDRAVSIDDESGGDERAVHDALGAEHHGDVRPLGRGGDGGPRGVEKGGVGRGDSLPEAAIPRDVAFREADDGGLAGACFPNCVLRQPHRLIGRCRKAKVGECDSGVRHPEEPKATRDPGCGARGWPRAVDGRSLADARDDKSVTLGMTGEGGSG